MAGNADSKDDDDCNLKYGPFSRDANIHKGLHRFCGNSSAISPAGFPGPDKPVDFIKLAVHRPDTLQMMSETMVKNAEMEVEEVEILEKVHDLEYHESRPIDDRCSPWSNTFFITSIKNVEWLTHFRIESLSLTWEWNMQM